MANQPDTNEKNQARLRTPRRDHSQNGNLPKINPGSVACFPPKIRPSTNHNSPRFHHKLTIQKPRSVTRFCQNPLQKPKSAFRKNNGRTDRSGIAEQGLEAEIHMLLDVAMEEREAGLVGGEVDAGSTVVRDDDRILQDPRGLPAIDLGEFKLMAVKMHGMGVVGAIAEDEPVTRTLLEDKLLFVWVWLAIHKPRVEFA